MLAQKGEQKILVCIEWKYVENYSGKAIEKKDKTYETQRNIYKSLLTMMDSPIKLNLSIENDKCDYDSEFVKFSIEPFYQLMRQTLLAWQLAVRNPLIIDDYIHLHLIPNANVQLLEGKTSPDITNGLNICDGWKKYLNNSNKYMHFDLQEFIGPAALKCNYELYQYLLNRYWS